MARYCLNNKLKRYLFLVGIDFSDKDDHKIKRSLDDSQSAEVYADYDRYNSRTDSKQ